MTKKTHSLALFLFTLDTPFALIAQQYFYKVTEENSYGLIFWNDGDHFKFFMGTTNEYRYGLVTEYTIKMNIVPSYHPRMDRGASKRSTLCCT